jgi:hypothetical protein
MQQPEQPTTTLPGLSNVPSLLAYPRILDLDDIPEIEGQFVYVIKKYVEEGLSVVIYREAGEVYLSLGDFDGNQIELSDEKHPLQKSALEFVQHESSKFVAMMKITGITKIILYISVNDDSWELVDLRASLDKFYGPGMIRDLFGKIFPTQTAVKTATLDEETLNAIKRGKGSYEGDLILKCSKFKTVARGKELLPLYARITR